MKTSPVPNLKTLQTFIFSAARSPLGSGWLYDNFNPAAPFVANEVILAICGLVLFFFIQIPKRVQVEIEL